METTLAKYVLTSTLTAEYKPTSGNATYASQVEATALKGEISTIQEQMVALGIATLVNGVLTGLTESIQAGAVATALAKCMKWSGAQTLTGNITLSSENTYTFCGALPSETSYLSGVTLGIQSLPSCISPKYYWVLFRMVQQSHNHN